MRVGWWALLAFTATGLGLEYLHAIKLASYLTEAAEPRRLMWTLGHAHGTALAILNIVFAVTLRSGVVRSDGRLRAISMCLIAATVLLPIGFFLGGVSFYGGDPGIGGVGIPVGAVLLIVAIVLIAVRIDR
jgi:hypothetical protein